MNKYYYEESQNRESKLTRNFVNLHLGAINDVLGITPSDIVLVEFDKKHYGFNGDVDIVVWKKPGTKDEHIIGIEVKVIFLNKNGQFKSYKENKHNKQIRALEKEGWDYVYLFDFIVLEPSDSWFHEQAFEGYDKYTKTVESEISGHVVLQFGSVKHKTEEWGGSISHMILKEAVLNLENYGREKILSALRSGNT